MKKLLLLTSLFLLIMVSLSDAQVRRIVLLEEATNASCPPCAANNPNLQAFFRSHFGGVISVRYHASWPGADPMYSLNPSENTARIVSYYGINGVPNYLMDGTNYGVPSDPLGMVGQMNQDLATDAPVKISVSANIDADSVRATITLTGVSPVTQTNLKFRIAIIERMIQYATPPGTNGETTFPDVMRKMYPDPNGYTVSSINPGDEITYYVSQAVNPAWNWQDLAVVGWLQSDATKEVIQSNISVPNYVIKSDAPLGEFLAPNQSSSKSLKIENDNDVDLHVRLKFTDAQVPSGWTYGLTYNGTSYDSVDITIAPGDSGVFSLDVNTSSTPGSISLALFAQNLDDVYNYGFTANYFGVVKNGNTLFIDDDGGTNSQSYYYQAFDSANVEYTSIEEGFVNALKDQILSQNFKAVFWSIGWGFPALIQSDIDFLESYLDGGGSLFIAGQDIGWDIFDPSGGSNFPAAQQFYHTYLDAKYIDDDAGSTSFTGVPGTLAEGITTSLIPISTGFYPEWIGSYSGVSDTIFQYTGTSKYGALYYNSGTYKTIYLGVGLEQFSSAAARQTLIQNVSDLLELVVPVELTSFSYNINENGVSLNWNTATELNNNGFEVQRSFDGSDFSTIGFVKGFGTTTQQHSYSYVDKPNTTKKTTLYYRLKQVDFNGSSSYSQTLSVVYDLPVKFELSQNYPNPFNPTTVIKYQIAKTSDVSLKVYNSIGQEVAELVKGTAEPGTYKVQFDARNLSSGVYFYKLKAGDFVTVKKMVVMK